MKTAFRIIALFFAACFALGAFGCRKIDVSTAGEEAPETPKEIIGTLSDLPEEGSRESYDEIKAKIMEEPLNLSYFSLREMSETEDETPRDGKHREEYYDVGLFEYLFDDIDRELYVPYDLDYFGSPEDANFGGLVERYGITKKEFEDAIRQYLLEMLDQSYATRFYEITDSKELFLSPSLYCYEIWFEKDYRDNELFISSYYVEPETRSVCIRPEGDDMHLDSYHTIDRRLIDFVGKDKFEKFKNKYGGTEDFNILKFVEEFGVTRQDYRKILKETTNVGGHYSPIGFCPEWIFPDEDEVNKEGLNYEWTLVYRGYFRQKKRSEILSDPETALNDETNKHVDFFRTVSSRLIADCTGRSEDEISSLLFKNDHHLLTYADVIELYSIKKEDFAEAVKKAKENYGGTEGGFIEEYGLCEEVDAWYSADPENEEVFLRDGYVKPEIDTVTIRCESDKVHNDRYYTIDRRLINYVTPEKFDGFKEKFAGTKNFNIVNFVKYFGITKDEAIKLFYETTPASYGPYPYDLNYLYGPEKLCEEYFSKIS
ncbi:MAG: hypothetical protein IJV00_01510 [Clostridia bacterium]|nr:hypothetical protein [Clostridia bacterium]